jgi:hypothetical protein
MLLTKHLLGAVSLSQFTPGPLRRLVSSTGISERVLQITNTHQREMTYVHTSQKWVGPIYETKHSVARPTVADKMS